MKIKDILLPFAFALLTVAMVNYFFLSRVSTDSPDVVSDRSFVVPKLAEIREPLDKEVDFYDAQATQVKQITTITTDYGVWNFSNNGAIVDSLAFKHMLAGKESLISVIVPTTNKEQGAFLVALNDLGNTPYFYNLVNQEKITDKATRLTYKGESASAVITKVFTIYDALYKLDLKIILELKGDTPISLRPRVLFPAPLVPDATGSDTIFAVYSSEKKSIESKPFNKLDDFGKENPSVFGLQDHYFMNALISDPQNFARRAFFKIDGVERAQAILQGISVKNTDKKTWNLSFYCGPKEMNGLSAVDPHLEGVLNYGWLTFICKPLLYLLNFFYSIFKNYGVAIIAVTVLTRLILLPFTINQQKSMKRHTEAQRKLQYIEQKYKHDPEALAREKAEFARKHGLASLNLIGCAPLLLQIPIFIGLQRVLVKAIELYKAPFFGWITDLSMPDPYYILPILTGICMAFQLAQIGNPPERVARIIGAIIIASLIANLSAGLVLYICVGTFLGVIQPYLERRIKI